MWHSATKKRTSHFADVESDVSEYESPSKVGSRKSHSQCKKYLKSGLKADQQWERRMAGFEGFATQSRNHQTEKKNTARQLINTGENEEASADLISTQSDVIAWSDSDTSDVEDQTRPCAPDEIQKNQLDKFTDKHKTTIEISHPLSTQASISEFDSDEESSDQKAGALQSSTSQDNSEPISISNVPSTATSENPSPSPHGQGIRGSDWVKQIHKTPEKRQEEEQEVDDSAKKRKKFIKGGFAEQLHTLLAREKSHHAFWMHQKSAHSKEDKSKSLLLTVNSIHQEYSVHIADCTDFNGKETTVMFAHEIVSKMNIQQGSVVRIYPPWQNLELLSSKKCIVLCTNYCQVVGKRDTDEGDTVGAVGKTVGVDGDAVREKQSTRKEKSQTRKVVAEWICPCSTDATLPASSCPAVTDWRKVTKSMRDHNTTKSTSEHTEQAESMTYQAPSMCLHTHYTPESDVSESLLECLEKRGPWCSGGLTFVATLQRVLKKRCNNDVRWSMLIEDKYGAFAELQMAFKPSVEWESVLQHGEGKQFCWRGLQIQQRLNRHRNQSLFSLIDTVWDSEKICAREESQESIDQGSSSNISPPNFCYVLNMQSNMKPVEIEDKSVVYRPVDYRKLAQIYQSQNQIRVSFFGQILYIRNTGNDQENHLYVTDRSLHSGVDCPKNIRLRCRNVCVVPQGLRQGSTLWCRDVHWTHKELTGDGYSGLTNDQNSCSELSGANTGSLNMAACLSPLTPASEVDDLVRVEGSVHGIDESTAFSWPTCDQCGNENLISARSVLFCDNCCRNIQSPKIKMRLDVYLDYTLLAPDLIKVQLQQSTIESLLPTEDEEGYDLHAILGKQLGPMACVVSKEHRDSGNGNKIKFELEEIPVPFKW